MEEETNAILSETARSLCKSLMKHATSKNERISNPADEYETKPNRLALMKQLRNRRKTIQQRAKGTRPIVAGVSV